MQSKTITNAAPADEANGKAVQSEPLGKHVSSFGVGFAVAALFTAGLFAIKAANPELEEWGEEVFGHAWFYQAVLALILFFGIGFTLTNVRLGAAGTIWTVILTTVVSGLIILGAATYATLQHEEGDDGTVSMAAPAEVVAQISAPRFGNGSGWR